MRAWAREKGVTQEGEGLSARAGEMGGELHTAPR